MRSPQGAVKVVVTAPTSGQFSQELYHRPMMRRTSNEAPAARGPRSVSTGSKRLSSCAFIKRWCPAMRPADDGPEFVGP